MFKTNIDHLFDIRNVCECASLIRMKGDKIFLLRQREPHQPGQLTGADTKLTEKEEAFELLNNLVVKRYKYFP